MTSTSTIGVAFLGVGRLGETHLRYLTGSIGVQVSQSRTRMEKRLSVAKSSLTLKLPLRITKRRLPIPELMQLSSLRLPRRMHSLSRLRSRRARPHSARNRLRWT